jgi:hypothetical protein
MEETNEESPSQVNGNSAEEPGQTTARLSRRDRRSLGRIADFLGVVDVVAVMMVIATVCTAVATWRTASIATAIYLASERPYMGVASVKLDHDRPGDPRIIIEYKNFGSVAAEGVVMFQRLWIDGKVVEDQTRRKAAGIVSPGSPHRLFMHVSQPVYDAVIAGRATMRVEVGAAYRGLRHGDLCYLERYAYEIDEGLFDVDGGSPRCEELLDLEATAASVPAASD